MCLREMKQNFKLYQSDIKKYHGPDVSESVDKYEKWFLNNKGSYDFPELSCLANIFKKRIFLIQNDTLHFEVGAQFENIIAFRVTFS